MPNPGLAASSAVFSGAQQGQEASNFYGQQLQAQQLDAALKRQALMQQLQQAQRQNDALTSTPKDEQQFLNLGGSVTDWQKRQDMTTQASALRDQMYQAAMDPTKPMQERMDLFQKSAQLGQNPELVQLPEFQKYGSGAAKVPKEWEFVDKDSGAPIIYNGGPIPPNAVTAGAYASLHKTAPQSPSQKMGETPLGLIKGINVVTRDGLPWPNPTDTYNQAIAKGGVPISDLGKTALDLNKTANDDLDNLLSSGEQVLPKTYGGVANALNPYVLGIKGATGDPNVAAYNSAKIALITHLRSVANASRVNAQELAQVNGALAGATSYPALQAAVKQARDLLAKSGKYLVKAGSLNTSTTNVSSAGAWTGKLDPSTGKPIFQNPDGSTYTVK